MHEFSLMQEALDIALACAREHGLKRIAELKLEAGRLSGVSVDALRFAWEYLQASDPLLAGAQLTIEQPAGHAACDACGFAGPVDVPLRICPACGASGLCFTQGEQFAVLGISGE